MRRVIASESGAALLMTILIITILSIFLIDTYSRSLLALTRARSSVNSLNAYYIMRSGVSAAMGFLERDMKEGTIDTLSEKWAQEMKNFPVGDGFVSVRIMDESSRFNINTLVNPQGKINDRSLERLGRLFRIAGIDEALARQVAEWLRRNREELSYTFRDTSELLLVPNFSKEAFRKVERYITVYTDRRNEHNINLNTAGGEVLMALSPKLNETLVKALLEYRKEHSFKLEYAGDLNMVSGFSDLALRTSFSDIIDVKSSIFSILIEAKVSDTVRKATAVVNRASGKVRIVAWKEV